MIFFLVPEELFANKSKARNILLTKSSQITVEPRHGFLVSQGAPGVLQFYNPVTDRFVYSKNYNFIIIKLILIQY